MSFPQHAQQLLVGAILSLQSSATGDGLSAGVCELALWMGPRRSRRQKYEGVKRDGELKVQEILSQSR